MTQEQEPGAEEAPEAPREDPHPTDPGGVPLLLPEVPEGSNDPHPTGPGGVPVGPDDDDGE